MKKIVIFIIVVFLLSAFPPVVPADNKDMVENRVDELDKINKEAVNQIAGKPESGIINIKVRAIPGKDGYKFEPIDKETTSSIPDTLLPLESGDKFFSFREGIARLVNKKPAITPYRLYSNEGEYITFKDAILRLSRSKK
ncbi:MAG: hypothetical protein R6V76_05905 [Desulfobacterales bacterium]